METLFDYKQYRANNHSGFFSRFMELELYTYINEFEMMIQVYKEKSVNIDCQKYILTILSYFIKMFYILINIMRRKSINTLWRYYDST